MATGYEKSHRIFDILVLQRKLPMNRVMLYSPMVSEDQLKLISSDFLEQLKDIARKENAIFYRLEINLPASEEHTVKLPGFIKSFEEMQPENNWVLDISKEESEVLGGMKQKGRYNIKIAEKNHLKLTNSNEPDSTELKEFFRQYEETGKRHKISYRGFDYFKSLLDIFGKNDYARSYTAWYRDEPLASAIIIFYGKSAIYLYGGSSELHRNLMAPYFLHWGIIKEAKERNLSEYNFLGIAPDENPSHPWAGITRFKKQFGGEQVDIVGCVDLPIRNLEYKAFSIAEKIRR